MKTINVKDAFTAEEADNLFAEKRLLYEDIQRYGITIHKQQCAVYHEGKLQLMLIRNALEPSLLAETLPYLRTVNGDPSNRSKIYGEGAQQYRVREDGALSTRKATPKEVVKEFGGRADTLGFWKRHQRRADGSPYCELSGWTTRHPEIFAGVTPFIVAVDDVYRKFAPEHHARQVEYLRSIPDWRLDKTAFTSLYVIKNLPTACHRDTFDLPEGFGVMATLGEFTGGELCLPRFKVAVDYQPGDVLLANVHELHGNFPLKEGERVTSVFFVRKGMHECPGLQ